MFSSMDDATLPVRSDFGLNAFQTFGLDGPAYQVLGKGEKPDTVRVRVLKSGEEFDYRLAAARLDPPA